MPRELTTIGSLRTGRRAALGVDWGLPQPRAMGCVDMGALRTTDLAPDALAETVPAARLDAAKAMNAALMDHGYNVADRPLYRAYQIAAGITPADAFPGEGTMTSFAVDMTEAGLPYADVLVYPWKASGTYDGVNAPPASEWNAPLPGTVTLPTITVTGNVPARAPASSSGGMTTTQKAVAWSVGVGALLALAVAVYLYMKKKHPKRRRSSSSASRRPRALLPARAA